MRLTLAVGPFWQTKAEDEVTRLQGKLEAIRDAVDEKNKELSDALKGFTEMQRSTQDREQELRYVPWSRGTLPDPAMPVGPVLDLTCSPPYPPFGD